MTFVTFEEYKRILEPWMNLRGYKFSDKVLWNMYQNCKEKVGNGDATEKCVAEDSDSTKTLKKGEGDDDRVQAVII